MIVRELLTKLGFNTAALEAGAARAEAVTDRVKEGFRELAGEFLAAWSVHKIIETIDEMQGLAFRLNDVAQSAGLTGDVLHTISDHASDARTSILAYGEAYERIALNAGKYLKTQKDVLQVTDTITKALTASGRSPEEQQSALTGFALSLGSSQLQGRGFMEIMRTAPEFVNKLADALKRPREEFKKLAQEGKISQKELIEAIKKTTDYFDEKVRNMPITIGQAFTIIGNRISVMLNDFNKNTQFATTVGKGFIKIWEYAEDVFYNVAYAIDFFVKKTVGWKAAIIGGAVGLAILMPQLTLIAGAIFLIIAVLDDIGAYLSGGKSFTGILIKKLGEAWNAVVSWGKHVGQEIVNAFLFPFKIIGTAFATFGQIISLFAGGIGKILTLAFASLGKVAEPFVNAVMSALHTLGDKIIEWTKPIRKWLEDMFGPLFQGYGFLAKFAAKAVSGVANAVTAPQPGYPGRSGLAAVGNSSFHFGDINISVPPGTPAEQSRSLTLQTTTAMDNWWNTKLRETQGSTPAYGVR